MARSSVLPKVSAAAQCEVRGETGRTFNREKDARIHFNRVNRIVNVSFSPLYVHGPESSNVSRRTR